MDAQNLYYSSRQGVLFDKSQTTLLQYPPGLAGSYMIPGSVTSIGDYAFGDARLTGVTIPGSVTNIGVDAFAGCATLAAIAVDPNNSFYCDVDGVLFNLSQTTLVQYPPGLAGSYRIPDGVTRIGGYAFFDCGALTGVTIPGSVTSLGEYAFQGCAKLISVTIPGSVTSLGAYAFFQCGGLTSVTIGSGVTSIGDDAFVNAANMTNVTIPGSVTNLGDLRSIIAPS